MVTCSKTPHPNSNKTSLYAGNEIITSHGEECLALDELKSNYWEWKRLKGFSEHLITALLKTKRGSKKLCEALKSPVSTSDRAGFPLCFLLFICCMSLSSSQVALLPSRSVTSRVGGYASLTCTVSASLGSLEDIQWTLNGTLLTDLNITGVEMIPGFFGGVLRFTGLSAEFNQTTIRCIATLQSGGILTSDTTLLLLQGLLAAVGNLTLSVQDSMLLATWTAPFTLTIEVGEDDISYCIDIINITSSSSLFSQCGINATQISLSLSLDDVCHVYRITVTPVNVVGRGERNSLIYSQIESSPGLLGVMRISVSSDNILTFRLEMSAPVCTVQLTFVDLCTGGIRTMGGTSVDGANITLTTEELATNCRYGVTISAFNAGGLATSHATISTHDVESVTFEELGEIGEFSVMVVYSEHSTASGALLSFVFITNIGDVDFNRSFLLGLDMSTSFDHVLSFALYSGGRYRVYVYDIERNGILSNGVRCPASAADVITDAPLQLVPIPTESCRATTSLGAIRVECDTIASGFQVIVQLNDVREVHKLYVNHTMGRTPVTVSVERDGEYLVSVLAIREGIGILESTVQFKFQVMVTVGTTPVITATSTDATTSAVALESTQVNLAVAMLVFSILLCTLLAFPIIVVVLAIKKSRQRKAGRLGTELSAAS